MQEKPKSTNEAQGCFLWNGPGLEESAGDVEICKSRTTREKSIEDASVNWARDATARCGGSHLKGRGLQGGANDQLLPTATGVQL